MAATRTHFVTGVTGTLGRALLKAVLTDSDDEVIALIRPRGRQTPGDRVRRLIASAGLAGTSAARLVTVGGDVSSPGLGLSDTDARLVERRADVFFHLAALTSLGAADADCNRVNVEGTREALQFAWRLVRHGMLTRMCVFSTAFVAGSRQTYCSLEDELPEAPAHANAYEASRYRAEGLVRDAIAQGLPATIFRPSIVVGDSRTGATTEFNVIYPFLKLIAQGLLRTIPARPDSTINIVPIDFVVNAALALSRRPDAAGRTYHLVTRNPPTVQMLLDIAHGREFGAVPPIDVVDPVGFDPDRLDPTEQFVYELLAPHLGYVNDDLTFDTRNTEAALTGTGLAFPDTSAAFLRKLVAFAVQSGYLTLPPAGSRV